MKTKKIKVQTFILPEYLASYLINDDCSGMEDSEIEEIDNWVKKTNPGYCVGCSEESYFSWRNDLNNLGSTVLEFHFHKI